MAGRYDVTMKHLLGLRLADWKPLFGVSAEVTVRPVDADLSHVAALADKVLRVEEDPPWILHPEPQAWRDDEFDVRMLHYHSTLLKQLRLPTHSVAVVLHPSAWSPENRGSINLASPRPGCAVRFEYQVIKVWELPVEMFLEGGVGLLPLAPLSDVSRTEMPAVIDRLAERLMTEVPRAEAADLGTATLLLMGLSGLFQKSLKGHEGWLGSTEGSHQLSTRSSLGARKASTPATPFWSFRFAGTLLKLVKLTTKILG